MTKLKKLHRYEVIFEGNILSVVKIFSTDQFIIFIEEKLSILDEIYRNFKFILNKQHEIYNKYTHNMYFYYFYWGIYDPKEYGEKRI